MKNSVPFYAEKERLGMFDLITVDTYFHRLLINVFPANIYFCNMQGIFLTFSSSWSDLVPNNIDSKITGFIHHVKNFFVSLLVLLTFVFNEKFPFLLIKMTILGKQVNHKWLGWHNDLFPVTVIKLKQENLSISF